MRPPSTKYLYKHSKMDITILVRALASHKFKLICTKQKCIFGHLFLETSAGCTMN